MALNSNDNSTGAAIAGIERSTKIYSAIILASVVLPVLFATETLTLEMIRGALFQALFQFGNGISWVLNAIPF